MARSRLLWPEKSRLWLEKEPAYAGFRRLPFPLGATGKSRLLWPKAGSSLARKEAGFPGQKPASSWPGKSRLPPASPASFRGARLLSPAESTSPHSADKRRCSAPERCCIWAPFDAPRLVSGKHSYGAQGKQGSRRKPAFTGFSWCGKAGFCRLCQSRLVPAKRGLYSGKEEPDPTEGPQRGPEGLFLTGKEGSCQLLTDYSLFCLVGGTGSSRTRFRHVPGHLLSPAPTESACFTL